jgi:predicted ester cyclase
MSDENKVIARRYFAAQDRAKGIDPDTDPRFAFQIAGAPRTDIEGYRQFAEAFYAAFPDLSHTVEEQVAEGDLVVSRFTVRGTHRGEFQGIPPTGKQFEVTAVAIDRIAGGKIVERWGQLDALGLMQQLGVIPGPS